MIKNILKVIIFISLLIFFSIYIMYLQKPASIDLNNIAGFYGEDRNSLDMVYIGGSASFVYYEPLEAFKKYGITSYDFGSNTIQADLYKYLVKETLKKQTPELIILDARAFQYRDIDQPPTEIGYRNVLTGTPLSINKYEFIEENVPKYLKEDTLSYHFDLIKFHGDTEKLNYGKAFKMMMQIYKNELKGFYFVPKATRMKNQYVETEGIMPVATETTNILLDLLEYLKTTKKKVLFVVSPYIEIEKEKAQFNYIEKIIKENGFDFLDTNEYYDEMKINFDTDFYNYNHTNIFGADKYTDFLSNYILSNYNIQDRRNDSKYSDWHKLLENWDKKVSKTKEETQKIIDGDKYYEEIYIKQ